MKTTLRPTQPVMLQTKAMHSAQDTETWVITYYVEVGKRRRKWVTDLNSPACSFSSPYHLVWFLHVVTVNHGIRADDLAISKGERSHFGEWQDARSKRSKGCRVTGSCSPMVRLIDEGKLIVSEYAMRLLIHELSLKEKERKEKDDLS